MICVVINSLGRGGAELSVLALLQELVRRGRNVKLICLFSADIEYAEPPELRNRVVRLAAPGFMHALHRLFVELQKQPPQFLLSLMPQSNLAAVIVGRWLRVPVLSSERTTPQEFYKPRAKLWLALLPHAFSQRALFISRHALDHGLPGGLLARRVRSHATVLHNPITARIPAPQAAAARTVRLQRLRAWSECTAGSAPPLDLLVAGRLVAGKGVLELLQTALPLLLNKSVRIHIAGTGPLQPPLEKWVQDNGVCPQVRFMGFVERIDDAYASCDAVLLNSESEGFGRVGFEAYLAGCLVLGTRGNSFIEEVMPHAHAWRKANTLSQLKVELLALASAPIDAAGADIRGLAQRLSIKSHTDQFLHIVKDGLHLDC